MMGYWHYMKSFTRLRLNVKRRSFSRLISIRLMIRLVGISTKIPLSAKGSTIDGLPALCSLSVVGTLPSTLIWRQTHFLSTREGVRQDDPLSPFLFNIV